MKKKHIKFQSIRTELIVYAFLSMGLAVLTELIVGAVIYVVSRVLGISYHGYGMKSKSMMEPEYINRIGSPANVFNKHHIQRFDHHTMYVILLVIIVASMSLFIIYFLLFIRRIIRDMSYISDSITHIATGDMTERIEIGRQDELGDIAMRVNGMQEQLHELMDSEREALQTNKDLITCVAHDLRTPVTSIMGYLELAMDTEHHRVEERQKYASIALKKAERLEGLIQDLFNYTKLMSGEITLHREKINLVQLVEQMIEEFYPIFQDHGLECTFQSNVTSVVMDMDGELVARAIQNLLSNASKYGRDGKQIHVTIEELNQEIQISVTNFGQVIPEESLSHVFDKFYRVEESRSTSTGGTGLGLNIAYEIIHLHGGTIQVSSSIQGTQFTIALPLEQEAETLEGGQYIEEHQ